MRVFERPSKSNNWKCPICKLDYEKEVVLIGIIGTETDNIMEAEQFHLDCIDLLWDKELGFIYQKLKDKDNG